MNNLTLGEKIREFRRREELSQIELELITDCSSGVMSRIESGQINPTKETILKIAKALKLSYLETSDLFGLQIIPKKKKLSEIYLEAFSAPELSSYVDLSATSRVLKENSGLFTEAREKNPKAKTREIIDSNKENLNLAEKYVNKSDFQFKSSKINNAFANSDTLMYEGKVVFINLKNPDNPLIIEDPDFYQRSVAIFNTLWNQL